MDELERFKRDINLVHYAGTCGYQVDRRESSRSSVVMRHPGNDDKIVIARNADDGHWTYFSVRDERDNGSVVDFVQRRRNMTLGRLRQELRPWVGGLAPSPPPGFVVPEVQALRKDRVAVAAEFARAELVANSAYLNGRGLRPETLADPRFAGTFRVDARGNVLFPHHDDQGLCGFETKNRGFTGFAAGGAKTIWHSRTKPDDRRLVLVESAIDGLSYHQLHPSTDTRYVSISGEPSPLGRDIIARAIRKMPTDAAIVVAFDRDAGGDKLWAEVHALVPERAVVRVMPPVMPGRRKDWNDFVQLQERDFIRGLGVNASGGLER
jgi:hypothetical protein